MSKLTREDAEHQYDVMVSALTNQLHHIAESLRIIGESHRSPGTNRKGRVECAMAIQDALIRRPSLSDTLRRLLEAAIAAEHPTARATPAELLDQAATALEGQEVSLWGSVVTLDGSDAERLADLTLRGAGVIR